MRRSASDSILWSPPFLVSSARQRTTRGLSRFASAQFSAGRPNESREGAPEARRSNHAQCEAPTVIWGPRGRWYALALLAGAAAVTGAWLDGRNGWVTPVFDSIAHQFYEVPLLAAIRRPSQLILVRWHLGIAAIGLVLGLILAPQLQRQGRACLLIFGIAYAIRAIIWICGGNLPLIPGDSSHGLEVATSVFRGEGPVKHYAESFFIDYPRIREGQSALDDWAPPLDAYVRPLAFRVAGLEPDATVEPRIVVAKACSFFLNLLALPALYFFALRRYGCRVALWSMAVLAVLPVHAIYAGFILRESLVVLLSLLAIWMLTEVCHADPAGRSIWVWAAAAGLCGGLTMLARSTGLALVAAAGTFAVVTSYRRRMGALVLWAVTAGLVALPWAWATLNEYGTPFYSETQYFEYNFSWTIHHYDKGNTRPSQFYTIANLPEIARVKFKMLLTIVVYSTMIVGLPIVLGFCGRLRTRGAQGRQTDLLVATVAVVFVLATLKSVADVTQVAQLGRYYLPVFALMLPAGVAGLADWLDSLRDGARVAPWLSAVTCRAFVGRPHLGLRRILARQALPAPLAGAARRRPLGPRPSGACNSAGAHHDVVPLGASGHDRPDDHSHAAQLQPQAHPGSDPAISSDTFPLGLVRAAAIS